MKLWVRTRNPDGSYSGKDVEIPDDTIEGAVVEDFTHIQLKDGRVFTMSAGYDDEIEFTEDIDNGDPVLIAKLNEEQERRNEEYYRRHPELRAVPRHVNCRCVFLDAFEQLLQPTYPDEEYECPICGARSYLRKDTCRLCGAVLKELTFTYTAIGTGPEERGRRAETYSCSSRSG